MFVDQFNKLRESYKELCIHYRSISGIKLDDNVKLKAHKMTLDENVFKDLWLQESTKTEDQTEEEESDGPEDESEVNDLPYNAR
jgi:hypothetical protein